MLSWLQSKLLCSKWARCEEVVFLFLTLTSIYNRLYVVDGKTTVDVTKSFKRIFDMNAASDEEEFEEQVNSEDEQTKVAFEGGEPTIISEQSMIPLVNVVRKYAKPC